MTNTCNDCGVELLPSDNDWEAQGKYHTDERCLKRQLEQLKTALGERSFMLDALLTEDERLRGVVNNLQSESDALDSLREPEGDSVMIFCPNPEFDEGRDQAIEVYAGWTTYRPQRFDGHTLLDCYNKALQAREAAKQALEGRG